MGFNFLFPILLMFVASIGFVYGNSGVTNRIGFERFHGEKWTIVEEEDNDDAVGAIELMDFGGGATLRFRETEFDTYVNPHAASEVRNMLKEIFARESLSSKGFSLDENEESASSDLLSLLGLTEDESVQRKCTKCGKQFSTSTYTHFHLIRDHLVQKYLQQPKENTFILLDKTCSFIDCSRGKEQSVLQSQQTKHRRLAECMYFMSQNVHKIEVVDGEKILHEDSEWQAEHFLRICRSIIGEEASIIPQTESKFKRFLWKFGVGIFVLMASSYYGILLLTQEGRRAWLTPLK